MNDLIDRIASLIADYHVILAVSTPSLATVVSSNIIIQKIDRLTTELETKTKKPYRPCIHRLLFG
jgi:hypothetical protein